MADQVFVDPDTHATLAPIAMGVVPAGTASAEFEAEWRYKWGQSGAGHIQTAFVLQTSTDGGVTWKADSTEFTLQVKEVLNPGNDPLFLGAVTAAIPTSRLDVAPARAGCGYVLGIKCQPSLRPGSNQEAVRWKLGVLSNETFRAISLNPDAPSGVLTGLGDKSISEWVVAPTLANGSDKVTLGVVRYVHAGVRLKIDPGDVALDQNDGAAAALASGEEYSFVLSAGAAGTITTTKGPKALAGASVRPAWPTDERPLVSGRVPYGGVIVSTELLAESGRCLVTDGGGLTVVCGPGRYQVPGFLITPVKTTLTLPDNSTSTVHLSVQGVYNLTAGEALYDVTTSGGAVTVITDRRHIIRPEPIRLRMPGVEAAADNIDKLYVPYPWTLERMLTVFRVPAAGGASGNTTVDVNVNGSGWTSDQITAGLSSSEGDPAPPWNYPAGWITTDIATITTGGTPAEDIEVLMWIVPTP